MLTEGMIVADRYEIVSKIGTGGMSDVYKAKDHTLGRFVAIKVLKPEFSEDVNFVTKFRTEAQSAAGLEHPNIVNIYDVGSENGMHYIVMEYVEGITLKTYIEKKGQLSFKEAVSIAIQVGRGIEAAHGKNIIHRDIKPQNIIVNPNGILKVTDFGIAKAATSATISSNAVGSVHYISPEQARGGFCDERSDIYSLGITMYEMVTGRVPFEGDNSVAVALMHIQNEMIPPREYYPDILPSFEKVIAKCTQKKPERRYLTANALIADLRRVEADPSGSFVKETTLLDGSKTRMIDDEEMHLIKEGAKAAPAETPYTPKVPEEEVVPEEEQDEDDMDPKLEKLAKILGVVAAVVVVLLIIFLIALAAGAFGGGKKKKVDTNNVTTEAVTTQDTEEQGEDKTVPSVVGKSVTDARQELKDAGFENVVTEYQADDQAEQDEVIAQTPRADATANTNDEIKLTVSSGQDGVKVPYVKGYKGDEAERLLKQDDFEVKYVYVYDDKVEEGKVISQDPAGGQTAAKNSTVTIKVSRGKEVKELTMINVRNMTLTKAKQKLESAGIKYTVTKANSDAYDKGIVIAQDYAEGDKITSDTTVSLTVSDGPDASSSANTTYSGTGTVPDVLPEGVDSGRMTIYLNGNTNPIYDLDVSHDQFPFVVNVENCKTKTAQITVYIDGAKKGTYSLNLSASN